MQDFVGGTGSSAARQQLVFRHMAWLTTLRYQLREQRAWETARTKPTDIRYGKKFTVDEWTTDINVVMAKYLSGDEFTEVMRKKNRGTQVIGLQSRHLRALKDNNEIAPLDYVEMEKLLIDLYDLQGRCERIKNFPYPRQFATISQMFTRLFVCLVLFGVLNEFHKLDNWMIWLAIPFSAVVGWIFLTMERVGENTENPFEGGANDVPITAMTRTIEIDLMELMNYLEVPPAITPVNNILT